MTESVTLHKFPRGTRLIIDVVFPDEYRIGWEYDNQVYSPGVGAYYAFDEAIEKAYDAFQKIILAKQ